MQRSVIFAHTFSNTVQGITLQIFGVIYRIYKVILKYTIISTNVYI